MAIKILSVDDELDLERLLTQYFRRKIKKGEYEFYFAHNGLEALQLMLVQPDFDVILSDINMPEMDGLTLLAKINEMQNPALKCIMVSAYGDMDNIRSAMNQGAFDFTTKPINLEDLERTIEKAAEQISFIKKAQQEHSQLESIRNDLHIAQEIQQTILPKTFPPFPELKTFDIYAYMNAAKYVGGDFYDFFRIDQDRLGFVIADVAGKGVPAAIFMAISRTVIRTIALTENSAAMCMQRSNTFLCQENVNEMFVTAFYGILNLNTGLVTYCNAGHNPPVLMKADNGCISPAHKRLYIERRRKHDLSRKDFAVIARRQPAALYGRNNRSDEYLPRTVQRKTFAGKLPGVDRKESQRNCRQNNGNGRKIRCRSRTIG